ncbi:MAG TPA: efflux RND transporter periplasmic adaptor subunit [Opitutaceae bacterium]|nr:efflux RND transporter periplasmic adaptor subunit [Opitutaceae bacterium]
MTPLNRTLWICLLLVGRAPLDAAEPSTRATSTVVLDATGRQNLRIQTVVAEPGDFEETVFALGRLEARPGHQAAVTSRISGRVVALRALPGDRVEAGAEVLQVESRHPGAPATAISLPAPLGGIVTRLDVRLGDPVEPDRALLEITDLQQVLAVARVPEHAVGRLKPGVKAHITVAAWPDQRWEGTLVRLATAADTASGTLDAYFLLPNPHDQLRPGLRAEFSIVVETRTDVVTVPRSALQGDPAGRFVYVKDFDVPNAFVKTPVVVGKSNDRVVEIVSGLLPADEVVTQGAYSLAFVGGGGISLKDALDAAHGHAHAADGSELNGKDPAKASGPVADAAADHGHDHAASDSSRLWKGISAVLAVALILVAFWRQPRPGAQGVPKETAGPAVQ